MTYWFCKECEGYFSPKTIEAHQEKFSGLHHTLNSVFVYSIDIEVVVE